MSSKANHNCGPANLAKETLLDSIGLYWALLDSIGLYWTLLKISPNTRLHVQQITNSVVNAFLLRNWLFMGQDLFLLTKRRVELVTSQ